MSTPIVDCHTHTSFSDGESTFEENVRAAAAAGCAVLVSTDHLTLPASMEAVADAQVPHVRLAEHRAAFEAARGLAAEVAPGLELVYGFECDWYPGCEANVAAWSEGAVVRLGSVHWIGDAGDVAAGATGDAGTEGVAPAGMPGTGAGWIDFGSDKHVWEELGADEVWRRYVGAWCTACESPLEFDSMAHPDLAMRFANEGFAATMDLSPLWRQMAECARSCGRRVELSTAGLRKSVGAYYPNAALLREFARAEVPITVGTDAHVASDICWGVADAYRYAAAAGYRSIDVPHADGSWEKLELE
jgi:HisJ family histidinol phosphate phosphatase